MQCGVFTLSIDTELAWGAVGERDFLRRLRDCENTRYAVDGLLGLLAEYGITATWAVVGHLLLEACSAAGGVKHPELIHHHNEGLSFWFSGDPCTDLKRDPSWYGRDLVERILLCPVSQEIGSHGFSHLRFDGISPAVALDEVRASMRLSKQLGVTPRAFVFPHNRGAHHDLLGDQGFIVYRGPDPVWHSRAPGVLGRACHFVDQALGLTPPTMLPIRGEGGLLNVPGSMVYLGSDGLRRLIPAASRIRKARKGIDLAAERREIFHLWLHPEALASDPRSLLGGLRRILHHVATRRSEGLIEVKSMGQLALECATEPPNQSRANG